MALKFMYITNKPVIAQIAQDAGVDRIFIDMEYIGKMDRQGGRDSIISGHTIEDIKEIRKVIQKSDILVRINPIHEASETYGDSKSEIDAAIEAGADILMLPYFKTLEEVKTFVSLVNSRVKTMLLLETKEAVDILDEILKMDGIDEIHIGLNDLSLSLNRKFMFEIVADGTIEEICQKIKAANIPYGFGGIARIGMGMLPAEYVIKEHYRLESSMVILSRSFCDANKEKDIKKIKSLFMTEVKKIRELEQECASQNVDSDYFMNNKKELEACVQKIIG